MGIWLFAMRYWTLSKVLEITLNKENPDKHATRLSLVMWIGVGVVFTFSCLLTWLQYYYT